MTSRRAKKSVLNQCSFTKLTLKKKMKPQPPTVACENGSSVGICTRCLHVLARFGAGFACSVGAWRQKLSRRSSAGSSSRVRCWLGFTHPHTHPIHLTIVCLLVLCEVDLDVVLVDLLAEEEDLLAALRGAAVVAVLDDLTKKKKIIIITINLSRYPTGLFDLYERNKCAAKVSSGVWYPNGMFRCAFTKPNLLRS